MRPASVVALGGGHGLYASLSALRHVTDDLTAVVTVADDGGSSGRLREEMGIVPPGDLRMALSALCEDSEWGRAWRDVLQTRFSTPGPLDGHAVGNLLIAGLWERTGDVVEGLDWVARLLHAQGRVLPLAEEPLQISAMLCGENVGAIARGQVAVATSGGRVTGLSIEPLRPKVPQATLDAIAGASAVVLGPGSWYTSVLVHFLVEPVAQALVEAGPRTVLTLNIAYEDAETEGSDRVDDVRALRRLEPAFRPAIVLCDVSHGLDPELVAEIEEWGSQLVVLNLKRSDALDRHDVTLLSEAYSQALGGLSGGGGRAEMAG